MKLLTQDFNTGTFGILISWTLTVTTYCYSQINKNNQKYLTGTCFDQKSKGLVSSDNLKVYYFYFVFSFSSIYYMICSVPWPTLDRCLSYTGETTEMCK